LQSSDAKFRSPSDETERHADDPYAVTNSALVEEQIRALHGLNHIPAEVIMEAIFVALSECYNACTRSNLKHNVNPKANVIYFIYILLRLSTCLLANEHHKFSRHAILWRNSCCQPRQKMGRNSS
jgi:hypothetical protein